MLVSRADGWASRTALTSPRCSIEGMRTSCSLIRRAELVRHLPNSSCRSAAFMRPIADGRSRATVPQFYAHRVTADIVGHSQKGFGRACRRLRNRDRVVLWLIISIAEQPLPLRGDRMLAVMLRQILGCLCWVQLRTHAGANPSSTSQGALRPVRTGPTFLHATWCLRTR